MRSLRFLRAWRAFLYVTLLINVGSLILNVLTGLEPAIFVIMPAVMIVCLVAPICMHAKEIAWREYLTRPRPDYPLRAAGWDAGPMEDGDTPVHDHHWAILAVQPYTAPVLFGKPIPHTITLIRCTACGEADSRILRPDIQYFEVDGTWVKPPGAVRVDIVLRPAGGGGSAPIVADGLRGRGYVQSIAASLLPDLVSVTVGKGGRPGGQDGCVLVITHLDGAQ
jgi:hypothetical protein